MPDYRADDLYFGYVYTFCDIDHMAMQTDDKHLKPFSRKFYMALFHGRFVFAFILRLCWLHYKTLILNVAIHLVSP